MQLSKQNACLRLQIDDIFLKQKPTCKINLFNQNSFITIYCGIWNI